ncbi:MAG: PEP-CTERM sorting domain-containing protein [Rhodopirellula sp. JB053]
MFLRLSVFAFVIAVMATSNVGHAALVLVEFGSGQPGNPYETEVGSSGVADFGIWATYTADAGDPTSVTIRGYSVGVTYPNPSVGSFDSHVSPDFNLVSTNPNIGTAAENTFNAANGVVTATSGIATQIGTVTLNHTNAPAGETSLTDFTDYGIDANIFNIDTLELGTLYAFDGGVVTGSDAVVATPEPSSLAALGVLGLVTGAIRRRRKAAKA